MTDRIGQHLGGYQLIQQLAEDELAETYLGEQQYTKTQVAIRIFRAALDERDAGRFRDAARGLTTLFHPHLQRVYDFGIETGSAFLVLEYPPNGSLRSHHPAGSQVPLEQALSYARQVTEALHYLHTLGQPHGDLRPEHLWLGRQVEVLVGDLPLPLLTQPAPYALASAPDAPVSNPYQAPEQGQGTLTAASDQYALGVLIYEWLTGALPQPQTPHPAGPRLHPSFLRGRLPSISPTFERALQQAIAADPAQRFPDIESFINALEGAGPSESQASPSIQAAPLIATVPSDPQASPAAPLIGTLDDAQLSALIVEADEPEASASPASQKPAAASASPPAAPTSAWASAPPPIIWPDRPESQPYSAPPPSGTQPGLYQPQPVRRRGSPSSGWCSLAIAILIVLCGGLIALANRIISQASSQSSTPTYPPPTTTILTYRGHHEGVYSVAWSPDGSTIASGDGTGNVQVWDATTGHLLLNKPTNDFALTALAWSPDGKYLASGGISSPIVWDARTGQQLYTYSSRPSLVARLAWSPNGKYLAEGEEDNTVQVWDALSGKTLFVYHGHSDNVHGIAWSPDSTYIASASGSQTGTDDSVQVWDALTGVQVFTYQPQNAWANAVAWSPNGKYLAIGKADGAAEVLDATSGTQVYNIQDHQQAIVSIAWSPDSTRVASASFDHTVRVWGALTGAGVYLYAGHSKNVWAVAWSPDGTQLASGSEDTTVQIWRSS